MKTLIMPSFQSVELASSDWRSLPIRTRISSETNFSMLSDSAQPLMQTLRTLFSKRRNTFMRRREERALMMIMKIMSRRKLITQLDCSEMTIELILY